MLGRLHLVGLGGVALLTLIASSERVAAQASIAGTVIDSVTGNPISGVGVYLPDQIHKTLSERDGTFSLTDVKAGRTVLLIRSIGYEPRGVRILVLNAESISIGTVRLMPLPVALTGIQVESTLVAVNPFMRDFFRRKRTGAGTYLTQQDIWEQNPIVTSDLLRRIPGIMIECPFGGCQATSWGTNSGPRFAQRANRRRAGGCPMNVIVDGFPLEDFSIDNVAPGWISGIEVYKGTAFTPIEYGRVSPCGTIIIWTGADPDVQPQRE